MATNKNTENEKPGKFKRILRIVGIILLIAVLIVGGFFLGIYLRILDSNEMNEKMGLYDMPIIGEYFVRPAPQEGASTVPDAPAEEPKKDTKESKPLRLSKEEIEKQAKEMQAAERKRVSKLARIYNEMKPADAAKILQEMDDTLIINILQRMDESQVSQVLAEFDTDRAAQISKTMYAGVTRRVQTTVSE